MNASITIDPARTIGQIHPNIYGQFLSRRCGVPDGGLFAPDHPDADEFGIRRQVAGVVAVGAEVEDIAEGARVAVDPSLFRGHCEFCRRGKGKLCLNWGAIGDTVNGAFAEYVAVPAANANVLPDHLSYREAALIEPVSCAVHGMHVLAPRMGDTVLIVGAGTMGLILLQLALHGGASSVSVLDLNAERLARAERLGAASTATDLAGLMENEPLGYDCVIDATGAPKAIESAFSAVKRGGKLLIFGVAPEDARVALSPFRIYNDEITVLGSMAVLNSYAPAVKLVANGTVDAGALLTGALMLDDYPKGARYGAARQMAEDADPAQRLARARGTWPLFPGAADMGVRIGVDVGTSGVRLGDRIVTGNGSHRTTHVTPACRRNPA